MVGIAVETMVTSTAAMKIESMHPAVTKRRRRMKCCGSRKSNTLVVYCGGRKTDASAKYLFPPCQASLSLGLCTQVQAGVFIYRSILPGQPRGRRACKSPLLRSGIRPSQIASGRRDFVSGIKRRITPHMNRHHHSRQRRCPSLMMLSYHCSGLNFEQPDSAFVPP